MPSPLLLLIPTHTPRYLGLVLAALAVQTRRPDTVVVSCDTDDPAIGVEIEHASGRAGMPIWWVRRAHHGGERLCQVRNNGVRHIVESLGITTGRLITLDGDTLAREDCLEGHARWADAGGADVIYPYRVDVPEALSSALTPEMILERRAGLTLSNHDCERLSKRQRRYTRQLLLRKLRLGPAHKPKLLGGHYSVDLGWYLKLNGFDELYQGWGFKDDEFAYRAAKLGATCRVAVDELIVFHLYHKTRQTSGRMADLPTAKRFARRAELPLVAEHGVRNPLPQNPVSATLLE
ncbi:MAG: galactosyltransferase-related protein [Phycisphaerales bacterium]